MPILKIAPQFQFFKDKFISLLQNFENEGEVFVKGNRNTIKIVELESYILNIKAFKTPNIINKIAYRYFRKSKAQRSFEYASVLKEKGIGTPEPFAYQENFNFIGLERSYYICEHLQCDLTYRELIKTSYPDAENILRQFTHFTFEMHEKGIEFLDHSPGNTLIKNKDNGTYSFYLVDLNRMKFHKQPLDFHTRMKNLSKLTPKKDMIAVMSNEYAKLYIQKNEEDIFNLMWKLSSEFQYRFNRKKRIKKKLKFWKK